MTFDVLVLARAPRPGLCKRRLEARLGPEGCALLQAVLLARAAAWARAIEPRRLLVAAQPADSESLAAVGEAVGQRDTELVAQHGETFAERLAAAVDRAFAGEALLVATVDLPSLSRVHAEGALGDLRAGCDVSVGPTTGGGFYLLGLGDGLPPGLRGDGLPRGSALAALLGEGGVKVGLLRSERDLHTEADADALLADPLCPADVREALTPA